MLSDEELKNKYPEAYRQGRVACKEDKRYNNNQYRYKSNEFKAYALGWGEYWDEHNEELIRETTNP